MVTRLPQMIDPVRLANRQSALAGSIELGSMARLGKVLATPEGEVKVKLDFNRAPDGSRRVDGALQTEVCVICQRCMIPMKLKLENNIRWLLVSGDAEAPGLHGEYEPLTVGDDPLSLPELIEDELIMAIPLAPMHDRDECQAAPLAKDTGEQPKQNPFAILETLKTLKTAKRKN